MLTASLDLIGQTGTTNDDRVIPGAFPSDEVEEVYNSYSEYLAAKYAKVPVLKYKFELFDPSNIRGTEYGDFCFGRLVDEWASDIGSGRDRGFERGDSAWQTIDTFKRCEQLHLLSFFHRD